MPACLLALERLPTAAARAHGRASTALLDVDIGAADARARVLTAIVTPFRAGRLGRLRRGSASSRATSSRTAPTGSSSTGTTGEAPTLTDDERIELYAAAVDAVGDRATVVAGTGTYSTAHSVHLTERAHELGVDGFLVVTPYYNKPPPRGIVEHFKAIAAVTDRPIVVYNIPSRVVMNIEPETIAELGRDPERARRQAGERRPRPGAADRAETGLDLYAGDDDLVFPFLELGGVGGVCVHTHVVGPQVKEHGPALPRAATSRAPARIDAELEPAYEHPARSRRTRSRSRPR